MRKTHLVTLLAVVLVACAARDVIFSPRDISTGKFVTHTGHAWDYNVWRMRGLAGAYSEGQDGRWLKDFSYGWGYPLFHHTGSLPYSVGAALYLSGFNINSALNMTWLIAFFLAGLGMYFVISRILGIWPALLACAAYTFAPYHLVDIFIRTNLGEFFAFSFLPFVLYGLWVSASGNKKGVLIGSLAISLIPLTHMLSSILAGFGFIIFSTLFSLFVVREERLKTFYSAISMAVLGLALSAWFWLPAKMDLAAARGNTNLVEDYYNYQNHFVYPRQLLSAYWEYGQSEIGPQDYMSFSLGAMTAILALTTVIFLVGHLFSIRIKKSESGIVVGIFSPKEQKPINDPRTERVRALLGASGITALIMAIMTLEVSDPIWSHFPVITIVQFPWRFLLPASFFLVVTASGAPLLFSKRWSNPGYMLATTSLLATSALVFLHWNYARAGNYDEKTRADLTSYSVVDKGIYTTNSHEFLSSLVTQLPAQHSQRRAIARIIGPENGRPIVSQELKDGWARVEVLRGNEDVELVLDQHWHPAWKVTGAGEPLVAKPYKLHAQAPIRVTVPKGVRDVVFYFGRTRWGQAGLVVSAFAFLVAVLLFFNVEFEFSFNRHSKEECINSRP